MNERDSFSNDHLKNVRMVLTARALTTEKSSFEVDSSHAGKSVKRISTTEKRGVVCTCCVRGWRGQNDVDRGGLAPVKLH